MDLFQAHRERVGKRIRLARLAADMSHDKLANRIGTSRQHLIKLEKGMHMPRPEMISAIAEATDRDEAYFLADEDDEEAASMPLTREEQDVLVALFSRLAQQTGIRA